MRASERVSECTYVCSSVRPFTNKCVPAYLPLRERGARPPRFRVECDEICQRLWKHEQESGLGCADLRGFAYDLDKRERAGCSDNRDDDDDAAATAIATDNDNVHR